MRGSDHHALWPWLPHDVWVLIWREVHRQHLVEVHAQLCKVTSRIAEFIEDHSVLTTGLVFIHSTCQYCITTCFISGFHWRPWQIQYGLGMGRSFLRLTAREQCDKTLEYWETMKQLNEHI